MFRKPARPALLASACGVFALVLAACGSPPVHNSAAETALASSVRSAVLAKGSVHISIRRHQKGKNKIEILSGDIGTNSADEFITQGSSKVSIRVTPSASYFSGNRGGLVAFLGLSKKEAARAGNRWVENTKGSTQYKDLYDADTMKELPSSLLPSSSDAVKLTTAVSGGTKVKVLTWTATSSGQKIDQVLYVPATGSPLPLTETTKVSNIDQTSAFSAWGEKLHVVAPPSSDVIAYSDITG